MVKEAQKDDVRIETVPERLKDVRELTGDLCEEAGLSEDVSELLVVAVDEAVTNIVNHAQATDQDGDVRVQVDINEIRFRALIEDYTNGTSVDSTNEERGSYFEEAKRHKLGIFLMQRIMDEINYTFKKGFQNDLELIRFFDESSSS